MTDQLLVTILAHLEDLEEGFRSGGLDSRADGHTARRSNVNVELARRLRRSLPGVAYPLDALTESIRLRAEQGRTAEQAVVEAAREYVTAITDQKGEGPSDPKSRRSARAWDALTAAVAALDRSLSTPTEGGGA